MTADRAGIPPADDFDVWFGVPRRAPQVWSDALSLEAAVKEVLRRTQELPDYEFRAIPSPFHTNGSWAVEGVLGRFRSVAVEPDGTPSPMFHATDTEFASFQPSMRSGKLIYFAQSEDAARRGAGRARSKIVHQVHLSARRPFNTRQTPLPWQEAEGLGGFWGGDWLREQGFDSVWVRDEAGVSLAVIDAAQVRATGERFGMHHGSSSELPAAPSLAERTAQLSARLEGSDAQAWSGKGAQASAVADLPRVWFRGQCGERAAEEPFLATALGAPSFADDPDIASHYAVNPDAARLYGWRGAPDNAGDGANVAAYFVRGKLFDLRPYQGGHGTETGLTPKAVARVLAKLKIEPVMVDLDPYYSAKWGRGKSAYWDAPEFDVPDSRKIMPAYRLVDDQTVQRALREAGYSGIVLRGAMSENNSAVSFDSTRPWVESRVHLEARVLDPAALHNALAPLPDASARRAQLVQDDPVARQLQRVIDELTPAATRKRSPGKS